MNFKFLLPLAALAVLATACGEEFKFGGDSPSSIECLLFSDSDGTGCTSRVRCCCRRSLAYILFPLVPSNRITGQSSCFQACSSPIGLPTHSESRAISKGGDFRLTVSLPVLCINREYWISSIHFQLETAVGRDLRMQKKREPSPCLPVVSFLGKPVLKTNRI